MSTNDHEHCTDMGQCWQDREPCPAATPLDIIDQHAGARLRVTWPNGFQRSGDVGTWTGSRIGLKPGVEPATCATFGGTMAGGEFLTAAKIERMGANGRYAEVWSA